MNTTRSWQIIRMEWTAPAKTLGNGCLIQRVAPPSSLLPQHIRVRDPALLLIAECEASEEVPDILCAANEHQ
jgi:hypothetical protein